MGSYTVGIAGLTVDQLFNNSGGLTPSLPTINKINMSIFHSKEKTDLPEGSYSGILGGYECLVYYKHNYFQIKTKEGVRTMNIRCTITVDTDGNALIIF